MRKVEELKAELTSLKEVNGEETKKGIQLLQAHATLSEELEKEKVRNHVVHFIFLTFHMCTTEDDETQCM